jgi:hypothetical protein
VVKCEPDPAAVVHGQSVTIALRIISGEQTPPERFRGAPLFGGQITLNPSPGDDRWSDWAAGASVTFTSTSVDPPARLERTYVVLVMQSLSTTRVEYCEVDVTHTEPTAVPTQVTTPTIRVEPEIVMLQLTGQVRATLSGTGFTPGGMIGLRLKPPGHQATTGTTEADSEGFFSFELFFQPNMPMGTYEVTASDRASDQNAQTTFEVR